MNASDSTNMAKATPRSAKGYHTALGFVARAAQAGTAWTRWNLLLWACWFVTFSIALAMTVALSDGNVRAWEVEFTRWARGVDYPEWLFELTADRLTNADTLEGAIIITAIAVALWLLRLRVEGFLILFSVALHVVGNVPKLFIERQSPSELIDGVAGTSGFNSIPSGHAEFAITFYGFLLYVALLYISRTAWRALLTAGWLILVLAVGFARIEVGQHWPLDVIAGYVIGLGLLAVLIWLHRSLTTARGGP